MCVGSGLVSRCLGRARRLPRSRTVGVMMTDAIPGPAAMPAEAAAAEPVSDAAAAPVAPAVEQTGLAAPPPAPRGLSYAVDIVFCVDVTGSMTPILDQV